MQQTQQKEKLYTVSQVAEIFKTSNVTMYKKIKKLEKELENEQIKNGRTTYLTEKAIEIIRENTFMDFNNEDEEDPGAEDPKEIKEDDRLINRLENEVEYLRGLIKERDEQIKESNRLLENFQVLLKNEQEKTLMIENKSETAITTTENGEEKRGFFGMFKKKR